MIEVHVLDRHHMFDDFMDLGRQPVPMLPLDRRTGVTEVEVGYDEESAMGEARRCLRCWVNTVFEGNEPDGSQCVLCGGCVDVCPENCLNWCRSKASSLRRKCWGRFGESGDLRCRTGRRGGRGARRHHRLRHAEGRDALHPLWPVCGALSGEHHHHGSLLVPRRGTRGVRCKNAPRATAGRRSSSWDWDRWASR